jgi:hypothetical protein
MELKTLFSRRDVQLRHFFIETENITHPLFPDPSNGAAFVPDFETSLAWSGEWLGFLLVGLKMTERLKCT